MIRIYGSWKARNDGMVSLHPTATFAADDLVTTWLHFLKNTLYEYSLVLFAELINFA
mgnify:FL=1